MARPATSKSRKRGPGAIGREPFVRVQLPPVLILQIEKWAAEQGFGLSRSQAIRQLVEMGLSGRSHPQRGRSPRAAAKASDMAAEQIDKLADASASEKERQQRKRRLLKGPSEFERVRQDSPKTHR